MKELIKKILRESEFEWADDLINAEDNVVTRAEALIPMYDGNQYIILFNHQVSRDEAGQIIKIIRRKGWPTSTGPGGDISRVDLIHNYSGRMDGYINLKNPISFGRTIFTFNAVNMGTNWDQVPKIKI